MDKPKVIVICGPTASGKTALSIELAKKINGEIISSDSMQIYKYMDIGTAKPSEEEKEGIQHYLLDFVEPNQRYSVAEFKKDAESAIEEILTKGKIPIVVGGTGLYINALTCNMEFTEGSSDIKYREKLNNYFNKLIKNDKMLEYSRELLSYVPDIPENRKSLFLDELIIALTIPSNHKSRGIFNPTPSTFIANCIWKIMKTYSQDEAEQRIIELINSYSSNELSIVVDLVLQIEYSYGRIGKDIDYNYRIISEEQLSNLEKIIIDKLIESSKTLNLFDLTYFYPTYIFWRNIDKDSLVIYVEKELRKPSNIPKHLKITANHWSSGQSNGWSFQKENFEGVLSNEDAYNSIVSLKSTQVFSELDDNTKKLAIAYCLWYERKDEKLNRVDEDEVNKYLSEWEYVT